MRYRIVETSGPGGARRHILIDQGSDQFISFPAEVGNPNYDSFLELQSLTDAEVQAMEPDVWHDMA